MTFGDILKNVRMKKACTMLREGNATVESIAETVGYQNVEHFNGSLKRCIRSLRCNSVIRSKKQRHISKVRKYVIFL